MLIYPAIDLSDGRAVRLYKGDYARMTVYNEHPLEVARDFEAQGASCLHLVDLDGAKSGETPNMATIAALKRKTSLFCEVGGGIRSMEIIDRYMDAGLDRVILGTAAVTNPGFAEAAVTKYGARIAIGVDMRDGCVAVKGWTEKSAVTGLEFCRQMEQIGVSTIICTDISKDGAMQGANLELYQNLSQMLSLQIIASGGVSSLEDVRRLRAMNLYGAIIGKAYYTGAILLREAIEVAT